MWEVTATKTQTVSRNVTTVTKRPAINAHWTDAEGDLISEDQGEPSDLHFYLHPSQQHHFTSDPHMSEDRTFFFFFPEGPHAQYADSSTPEASDGQWPHQASFQHRGQQRCSTGHANTPWGFFSVDTQLCLRHAAHTRTHTLKHHNVRHKQAKLLSY